jgi:hypothetical protein
MFLRDAVHPMLSLQMFIIVNLLWLIFDSLKS